MLTDKAGDKKSCPGCAYQFTFESWRDDDGPCWDGRFYCTDCLTRGRCGCVEPIDEN